MTALDALQDEFLAALLGRPSAIERHLVGDARASAAERLGIYTNAYWLRLAGVLETHFPVLAAVLGDADFGVLAREYTAATPSAHPNVRWFGAGLADHLSERAPWSDTPALAELARFEWLQGEVADAADDDVLAIDTVAAVAPARWPEMRLCVRACVRRIDLHWNTGEVMRAFAAEVDPLPRPERAETPTGWVLWRDDVRVRWRSLEASERVAFDACARGETFGEICERIAVDHGDGAPLRAAGALKQWLADGWLTALD